MDKYNATYNKVVELIDPKYNDISSSSYLKEITDDSISLIKLVFELENLYSIEFTDDILTQISKYTLHQLIEYITDNLEDKNTDE